MPIRLDDRRSRARAPREARLAGAAILVVEDDPLLRWTLVRLLARVGARVSDAGDGDQALTLAALEQVDLLLTDMDMPGRDGAAVALAVTAIWPSVAVVFMSGRSRAVHLASGRLVDGDCLVEKPFNSEVLVDALASALGHDHAV